MVNIKAKIVEAITNTGIVTNEAFSKGYFETVYQNGQAVNLLGDGGELSLAKYLRLAFHDCLKYG